MDRITAARARLDEHQRALTSAEYLCVDCDHYREGVCVHPAIVDWSRDPLDGAISTKSKRAREQRADSGLCGPEGALFVPKSYPRLVVDSLFKGFGDVVVTVGALGIAGAILVNLFG